MQLLTASCLSSLLCPCIDFNPFVVISAFVSFCLSLFIVLGMHVGKRVPADSRRNHVKNHCPAPNSRRGTPKHTKHDPRAPQKPAARPARQKKTPALALSGVPGLWGPARSRRGAVWSRFGTPNSTIVNFRAPKCDHRGRSAQRGGRHGDISRPKG